jgi:2-dehydro-3-deoxyglucarate aldolase
MINKTIKQKLKNRELTIGSWITIGHPSIAEILASANFDWLVIDIEHTTIDLSMVQILITAIQSRGIAAFVRVSKNEEVIIKRVLDAGADGIIVPMICSADEAKQAVKYAKYPPEGTRGVGLARAQQYGTAFEAYKEWVKTDLVVIAQIEHINGINDLENILEVEGIDGVFIGPYDLSGSLGIPGKYEEPIVVDALERFKRICKEKRFSMGFHVIETNAERLQAKIDEGYNFIAFSTDFLFMGTNARNELGKIR